MNMKRLGYFCTWAGSGDPRGAAQAFLTEASASSVMRLLDAAHWRDEDVMDFERRATGLLIETKGGGRFWLAPRSLRKVLLPPAVRIDPAALVALARGLVDELAEVPVPAGGSWIQWGNA